MPRAWATPEQAIWLQARIPDFLKAQADKNLPRYYAKLFEDWFDKWSERDRLFGLSDEILTQEQIKVLGEAVEAQRKVFSILLTGGMHFNSNSQRLKTFLNWHAVNHRQRQTAPSNDSTRRQELARRPRVLQEAEIYCKIHYESKLKAIVGQRVSKDVTRGKWLSTLRKVAKECYETESDEVKSGVRAELSKQMREREKAMEAIASAERGTERTAEQYQAYVVLFLRCLPSISSPSQRIPI
jgi:hypothetical protein